jgi:hypothetical protein
MVPDRRTRIQDFRVCPTNMNTNITSTALSDGGAYFIDSFDARGQTGKPSTSWVI